MLLLFYRKMLCHCMFALRLEGAALEDTSVKIIGQCQEHCNFCGSEKGMFNYLHTCKTTPEVLAPCTVALKEVYEGRGPKTEFRRPRFCNECCMQVSTHCQRECRTGQATTCECLICTPKTPASTSSAAGASMSLHKSHSNPGP